MRTRVRPTAYTPGPWSVDVYNPHTGQYKGWVEVSTCQYFWYANWRANRLAKGSLEERFNVKERFLNRLKFGKESNE